jgi:hypothetical protein
MFMLSSEDRALARTSGEMVELQELPIVKLSSLLQCPKVSFACFLDRASLRVRAMDNLRSRSFIRCRIELLTGTIDGSLCGKSRSLVA